MESEEGFEFSFEFSSACKTCETDENVMWNMVLRIVVKRDKSRKMLQSEMSQSHDAGITTAKDCQLNIDLKITSSLSLSAVLVPSTVRPFIVRKEENFC